MSTKLADTIDQLLTTNDLASLFHLLLNRAHRQGRVAATAAGGEEAEMGGVNVRPILEVLVDEYGFKHIRDLVQEIGDENGEA